MDKSLIAELKRLLREMLEYNNVYELKSDCLLSCTKTLVYLDHIDTLQAQGTFKMTTSYTKSDGYNDYTHSYSLLIEKDNASLSSRHSFQEAYGQHYECHEEQLYPDDDFSFSELSENYNHWKKGFLTGLAYKISFTENLKGIHSLKK